MILISGGGALSESEAEDDPEISRVTLPHGMTSRGNVPSEQSSVRLVELGPRMLMSLVKIEEGMLDGEVLYHKWVQKTDEEKKKIKVAREKRRKEKEKRKKEQEQNVKKKELSKEEHKQKSLEGMMKKNLQKLKDTGEDIPTQFQGEMMDHAREEHTSLKESDASGDDTDEEWYRKEVGEEPEKDLFDGNSKGKKRQAPSSNLDARFKKRMKKSNISHSQSGSTKNQRTKTIAKTRQFQNSSSNNSGAPQNSVPKWKFKASGATKMGASSKQKLFSSKSKDFKKGNKEKRPTRVYNSEGVGPNYKKYSTKNHTSDGRNKSRKSKR